LRPAVSGFPTGNLRLPARWPSVMLRVVLSLPVAAIALAVAFRHVQSAALADAFFAMRWGAALIAVTLAVLLIGARVLRWAVLVQAITPLPLGEIARVGALGFMAIDLFPARLGELVRPGLLARRDAVPVSATLATIVVERLLDLTAVLACLLGSLWLAHLPGVVITIAGRQMDLAVGGRNAVLVLLAFLGLPLVTCLLAGEAGLRLLEASGCLLPAVLAAPMLRAARTFSGALRMIGRPATLVQSVAVTVLIWLLVDAVSFAVIRAVGLDEIGAAQATLVMVVVSLTLLLPSPAGGLGVFEAGGVAGLSLFGVAPATAAAYAIAVHATHVAVCTLIGAIVIARDRTPLADLWRAGTTLPPIEALQDPRHGRAA
jgi:uncharacterized membrane protein YbhN (UPF0104 family)